MKTIQVKWNAVSSTTSSNPYYSPNPQFGWFGKKVGDHYLQASSWHGCRETLVSMVRRLHTATTVPTSFTKIVTGSLRILVKFKSKGKDNAPGFKTSENEVTKWMKESVRMVNIFEKYMGWPLTRLSRVSDQTICNKKLSSFRTIIFGLEGSGKWMRSPQLLSLYLLIIRLGRFHGCTKEAFKKIGDLIELSKVISATKKEGQANDDAKFLRGIRPLLLTILDNRKTLFFRRSAKEHFTNNLGNYGITKLVNGTADKYLIDRFNEAKKLSRKGK